MSAIRIALHGLYLSRHGRQVGIVQDRGAAQTWRWLTTGGYYVTADGRAALVGESSKDLTVDITPTDAQVAGADSMFGVL